MIPGGESRRTLGVTAGQARGSVGKMDALRTADIAIPTPGREKPAHPARPPVRDATGPGRGHG